ncbi:MAG TPA: DUF2080 family transposase-associated protein [Candidatus Nanoarchaeia archaeon]|nr:DUF2080 family transposase-associated protein [Candidatus Nanoarchaeia archaeon]
MIEQEQIRKQVMPFGNGSIVYTPKAWIGREVVITLPKRSLKEEILDFLLPSLENIQGIYLYGSHARNEQEEGSDIDILIIADEKFSIERKGFEISIVTKEGFIQNMQSNPFLVLIVKEAKPILNKKLLEELKSSIPKHLDKSFVLETIRSVIKINEEFISQENENFQNYACIYSLMLRLREMYMLKCIEKNISYHKKQFKEELKRKGISRPNTLYSIYQTIRNNQPAKNKIKKQEVEKLLSLLKHETQKKS